LRRLLHYPGSGIGPAVIGHIAETAFFPVFEVITVLEGRTLKPVTAYRGDKLPCRSAIGNTFVQIMGAGLISYIHQGNPILFNV
jgi:hypothetical protein